MVTERDKWVFDNLTLSGENSESTDMDVNVFFDLMEDMVNKHSMALCFHTQQSPGHNP